MKYVQCLLEKKATNRYIKTQSWIPKQYARVCDLVDIIYDGELIKGWTVLEVYKEEELVEEEALKQTNYYKNHKLFSNK